MASRGNNEESRQRKIGKIKRNRKQETQIKDTAKTVRKENRPK